MLADLQDAIRQLLYEEGNIPPSEVDIKFDAPTREWVTRLTRPTVSIFLYGIQENGDLRQTSFQSTRVNGRMERRVPPRRIDLRYLVSALTSDVEDEHRLLWRALATFMRYPEIPTTHFPDALQMMDMPLTTRIAQADDGPASLDVWSGLGTDPHPALNLIVTLPLDLELVFAAPLVLTRTLRFGQGRDGVAERTNIEIGGFVRDGDGTPLGGITVTIEGSAVGARTTSEGEFVLRNVPEGALQLRITRPDGTEETHAITVPADTYDIVLD